MHILFLQEVYDFCLEKISKDDELIKSVSVCVVIVLLRTVLDFPSPHPIDYLVVESVPTLC